ncbi:MAG: DUF192 domain-containing protein [Chloroflexi bacterium]|nr:DUF192 domain-containing protein [Chloroflexota bacterium]
MKMHRLRRTFPGMKFCPLRGLVWLAALTFAGCGNSEKTPAAPSSQSQPPSGQPQPKLQTVKLWLGAQEMIAEVARTPSQIQKGMMFRKEMAENEGMLFIFPRPHRASFWMKNTLIALSCAYLDAEGVILEIHDMKPLDETPIEAVSDQVSYVLETKQGWFERNKVGTGAVVRTERGSLAKSFLGGR